MEMEKKLNIVRIKLKPRETPQEESSSSLISNETESSTSDVSLSPTPTNKIRKTVNQQTIQDSSFLPHKKRKISITEDSAFSSSKEPLFCLLCDSTSLTKSKSNEQGENPKEYLFLPSKELEMDMSRSSASTTITDEEEEVTKLRKIVSRQHLETTQESSFLSYKGTEMSISDVPISQEPREATKDSSFLSNKKRKMSISDFPILAVKKRQMIMIQQPREMKKLVFCLLGGSTSQEPRGNPKEYLFLPSKEVEMNMLLSSASPNITDEEELTRKLEEMRFRSDEEKAEEKRYGISTELYTNPWIIKKELSLHDTTQSRVYLKKSLVTRHILRYFSEDDEKKVEGNGMRVKVYDHDTDTTHEIVLLRVHRSKHYSLKDNWRQDFVKRRGLKQGDKIGLFWDCSQPKLHFRVLSRAVSPVISRLET